MPTVSVDNSPVSVQISYDESMTVPTGETWVVTISGATNDSSGQFVKINGTYALSAVDPYQLGDSVEHVLTAGDTVAADSSMAAAISGWVL